MTFSMYEELESLYYKRIRQENIKLKEENTELKKKLSLYEFKGLPQMEPNA